MASSSRIHDAFTKPRLPALGVVEALVFTLAELIPRVDPETEAERFRDLWEAAAEDSTETADVPAASNGRDLQPPPVIPRPPAVPPARIDSSFERTIAEAKARFVSHERYEKLCRVNDYLAALERGVDPEVPQSEILRDMISLLTDEATEIMSSLHGAQRIIQIMRNSTENAYKGEILSARFEQLNNLRMSVRRMVDGYSEIKGAADFEKARNALKDKSSVVSLRITALTRPLDVPL
ncbi:hypothetical protein [Streptomyces cinereoruber]|uniref:hypothetical protein n=1 Tax=Streptomyces cinereoruber TaxID=67260 RepID=UPI003C2CCEF9